MNTRDIEQELKQLSSAVIKLHSVIEARIDPTFEGFSGDHDPHMRYKFIDDRYGKGPKTEYIKQLINHSTYLISEYSYVIHRSGINTDAILKALARIRNDPQIHQTGYHNSTRNYEVDSLLEAMEMH